MATITAPPINVNNATDRGEAPFSGPFEPGDGFFYLVTIESTPVQGLHVWRSADKQTWTLLDSANQPDATGGFYDVALDGAILRIAFAEGSPASTLQAVTFNTAGAGSWGVPVDSTFDIAGGVIRLVVLSDSSLVICYQKGDTSIQFTTFAAGVFGVETVIHAAAAQSVFSAVVDAIDVTHVFWNESVTGTITLYHSKITAGVVGARQAVHANTNQFFCTSGKSNAVISGASLVFPSANDAGTRAGVWIGTPLAVPVWTFTLIDDIDWTGLGFAGESDDETFVFVDPATGNLYAFWIALDFDDPLNIIDREYYKVFDGATWSDPVLFYDAVTDPQTFDPVSDADQFIHATNFTVLSDGSFGALIALETPTFCAPFYLLAGCDITITVTPHGSSPVTVPDDAQVFALPPAYGLTPYTFGGSSPTPNAPALLQAVEGAGPPQNFEYSITQGSLPQGMFLGASISGQTSPPVQSSTGLSFQGTPADNPTTPQTFVIRGKARLVG
jgi:hypothetical protein